jgi:hypothetical protein
MKTLSKFYLLAAVASFCTLSAYADSVPGAAVIYAAGTQSGVASSAGGTLPIGILLPAGTSSITFGVTGSVVLNIGTGTNYNDPDGVGAAVSSSFESGSGSISGLTAPNAGFLTGVFLAPGGPSGPAPTALNFLTSGTSFLSLSPLVDQTFFIGDGLTGDGTGATQTFYVPAGASELYLGISDACGYNGGPSCYGDNGGSFDVSYSISANTPPSVPEPSSFVLLGTGVAGALSQLVMRRRRAI